MKRSSYVLAVLALLCALFVIAPALLRAQMSTGFPGQAQTPAQTATMKVQGYALRLSLSSAQQEQAVTIFTAEETAMAPVHAAEREAHAVLQTAIRSANSSTIAQVAVMLGELTRQGTVVHATAEAQFWAILTAEQQQRYAQMSQGQRQSGGSGGFGMGGGSGFGGGMGGPPPPPR